jgi:arylformamidase
MAILVVTLSTGCSARESSLSTTSTVPTEASAPESSPTTATSTTQLGPGPARCEHADLPATVAYTTIPGVDTNLTSLDVYPPASSRCNAPVVMWVHGGGYQRGDKGNQVRDKVRLFNDAGWILVSVNYRLTVPGQVASAAFPDHYDDIASAVAWVHDHIAPYGGDATRVALLGHSAGADIVANVVTNPTYLQAVGLDLTAIKCAGPLDTEGFDKEAANASDPDGERTQWKSALGNNPNYVTATSATSLVKPGIGIPPMIGVVRGSPQRQRIETAFLTTLAANGVEATTIDARSLTHAEVNTRIGALDDTVMTKPLMVFLTNCFD